MKRTKNSFLQPLLCDRCGYPYYEHPIRQRVNNYGDIIEEYAVNRNCPNIRRQATLERYTPK